MSSIVEKHIKFNWQDENYFQMLFNSEWIGGFNFRVFNWFVFINYEDFSYCNKECSF